MPSPRRVVVAGAGLAAHNIAEHLRRRGFAGRIVLLGDEAVEPYDRPPLSKDQLWSEQEPAPRLLARPGAYQRDGIEVRTGSRTRSLDTSRKTVTLADGEEVPYDSLVIATGSRARTLADSPGVLTLRSFDDCLDLRKAMAERPRIVIVGAGLIGCEVAGHASSIGLDVTVVDPMPTPLTTALGRTVGNLLGRMHQNAGSTMLHGLGVEGVIGHGRAEAVRLTDGTTLPADLVLVAFGATPNVEWLAESGIDIGRGVVTDELCRTSVPDVYAIGDVAQAFQPAKGTHMVIEHWNNAREQGAGVAATILGEPAPPHALPYFWTDQLGTKIQSLGWLDPDAGVETIEWQEPKPGAVHLFGSPERLTGAVSFNAAGRLMKLRGLIEQNKSWAEAEAIIRG
ncbi:FAD-dependent oxidoreductase [Nocardia sp. NPDC050799]|uniref:NAD(P)/FAD-dependent oxidoreductase n=1 Tax=Nocardia sp. NPDC050799 TaxID=3154842 RepID=UPI0033C4A297